MRLSSLVLLLLLAAAPAISGPATDAGSDPAPMEIRLGKEPPPPPPVDPGRVRAVERFLAARQEASKARFEGRAPKLAAPAPRGATAEDLYGPQASRLIAFDFQDAELEPIAPGRFRAAVYVLFADELGQIVESRDELLQFSGSGSAWSCVSLQATSTIAWDSGAVSETATSLGVADELHRARVHLLERMAGAHGTSAYSVADVAKEADGRVVVQCLRFSADTGRRGIVVNDAPVVLSRDRGVLRVESN